MTAPHDTSATLGGYADTWYEKDQGSRRTRGTSHNSTATDAPTASNRSQGERAERSASSHTNALDDHDDRTPYVEFGPPVEQLLADRWQLDRAGVFDPCPIPGHRGRARLTTEEGILRLECCGGETRSVGEVWAARAYRKDVRLSRIQLALWNRRVGYEAETFVPLDVPVPLPDDLSQKAARVRRGFKLAIGLYWRDGDHRPISFSVSFIEAWCLISHGSAQRALNELIEKSVIERVGYIKSERANRCDTPLYLPGNLIARAASYGGGA